MYDRKAILREIIESANHRISDILPSEWAELNRIMSGDTPKKGPFSFENAPYTREIADCAAPSHPARIIVWMKGAQIGGSTAVIENVIAWIISENPGNILFLVGDESLVKTSVAKVDRLINDTGIRSKIGATVERNRNNKSGDTDERKDFNGGYLKIGATRHKALRQESFRYGFIDDFEAMKGKSKESGSTTKLVEQRFAAFDSSMKLFYISTPERLQGSNINSVFLKGDQRYYHIPCPCCGVLIPLFWDVQSEINDQRRAGITWLLDDSGRLIEDSVGYICQKCEGFFTDERKSEWLRESGRGGSAKWIPTAEPSEPGYYSYHLSALYAPTFMYGWIRYVRDYIAANPVGGNRIEQDHQVFVNTCLGMPYAPTQESIKANDLQRNIRAYDINSVPEKMSIADGNGKIVLLTVAFDMNGTEDDARLDYEVVAWSESESSYSIDHGSIGTFIPRDPGRIDRARWSYHRGRQNSVWPEVEKLLSRVYDVDTGRKMRVMFSGIDTGYLQEYAWPFIDNSNGKVIGVKGDALEKYSPIGVDKKTFKQSQQQANLYLVNGNLVKDKLYTFMKLKHNPDYHEVQPAGFLNFPQPSSGKYIPASYFSHFEAEHKVYDDKQQAFVWKKKSSTHQNHLWDCRVYNIAVKDILVSLLMKELKIQNFTWKDYCDVVLGRREV
jgi:phage terminase large subunit GpA-like protein